MINAAQLEDRIAQQYDQAAEKIDDSIQEWLKKQQKLAVSLDKWLHSAIMETANRATLQAVGDRSNRVKFSMNLTKLTDNIIGTAKKEVRHLLNPHQLLAGLEFMCNEHGYRVEAHILYFELELLDPEIAGPEGPELTDQEIDLDPPPPAPKGDGEETPAAAPPA